MVTSLRFPLPKFILILGVALTPVYLFDSGGVQPAHMVLALFATLVFLQYGVSSERWVLLLAALGGYSFAVECFYGVLSGDSSYLVNSLFIFYNVFVASAINSYCRRGGVESLVFGVLISAAIALFSVTVLGDLFQSSGVRSTGAFNNPNQLGYFSVCILSLTYLLYIHGFLKYVFALTLFASAILLSVASLSKAAMIANFLVVFLALKPAGVSSRMRNFGAATRLVFWGCCALIAVVVIFVLFQNGMFGDLVFVQRLLGIRGEADSSLDSRGYFAFLEVGGFRLLFGIGAEGAVDIVGHEIHSTFASVFNNYGVVGFFLFSSAIFIWVSRLWRAYGFVSMICLVGPAMLYGLTHNGTRFTLFWVLFAASIAMAARVIKERKVRASLETTRLIQKS